MSREDRTVGEAFRRRRREMSLTQAELAKRAGCTQSAVSMFEAGRSGALAAETVERVAQILDIDLAAVAAAGGAGWASREFVLKYCPIDGCPSNIPYAVGDRLCFRPTMVRAPSESTTRCAMCGELMESLCPNAGCGEALAEGSFCPDCGAAYVPVNTAMTGWRAAKWADERREKIREIRELSRTVSGVKVS